MEIERRLATHHGDTVFSLNSPHTQRYLQVQQLVANGLAVGGRRRLPDRWNLEVSTTTNCHAWNQHEVHGYHVSTMLGSHFVFASFQFHVVVKVTGSRL